MAQSTDEKFKLSLFWTAEQERYTVHPKKWFLKFQMWTRLKHDIDLKHHDEELSKLKTEALKKEYEAKPEHSKQL